jgi:hypothetical protein
MSLSIENNEVTLEMQDVISFDQSNISTTSDKSNTNNRPISPSFNLTSKFIITS